jgi:hypothetical protein
MRAHARQDKPARSSKGIARLIRCLAAALILGFAGAALAQTVPPAEPPPAAEPGTGPQSNCIAENDGYQMRGTDPFIKKEIP